MPKRVIDLGATESLDEIQLLEHENQTASYIALSHSWGGVMPDTLTKSIESQLPPFSEWPRTFQDALSNGCCSIRDPGHVHDRRSPGAQPAPREL